jgi:uncharacterized protein
MGRLLGGGAPLRGRAGLELIVPTLDYRLAAEFWDVRDPVLAVKVHAIAGGTPAYRREFARDDTPAGAEDFDGWVRRTVLNPASPLFREARYLLTDEPDLRDVGLYHSVLAAIAEGNRTRGGIASYLGRKSGDLAHPLNVLADCGLVISAADAFRDNRTTFRIAEPLITFYHAVMRPIWSDLEHTRDASRLWQRSQRRFTANVLGPHFEQLCRSWLLYHAAEEAAGGIPVRVQAGTVHDAARRVSHELDVVAFGLDDAAAEPVIAIGEVKWNEVMSMTHLDRLRHIRGVRPPDPVGHLGALQAAVFTDRRLRLRYRSSGRLPEASQKAERGPSEPTVDPYGLVCKAGIWYLVADQDGEPRLFRVSRVAAAEPDEAPVRRRCAPTWLRSRRKSWRCTRIRVW